MVRRVAQAKPGSDDGQRVRPVCRCCAGWVEPIDCNSRDGGFFQMGFGRYRVSQLSTLFMQMRGGAPSAAMAGPAVLLVLAVIYWFIRT